MLPPRIVELDDIVDAAVGGKAYGLARLQRMGLAVPPAFVICNAVRGEFPADLDRYYASLDADRVAVRSSAVGEDGGEASFAGQYDTVLNVSGVAALRAAIDRCVSSAADERAASYRRERDACGAPSMNVVVQAMVDAHRAGVVFTADPVSGRRDVAVIDVVAGLGEALVSGEVTPDHYLVDSTGGVLRSEPAGSEALLDAQQLRDIVDEARAAEAVEGRPLDLEWAMDADGRLFWLQARPITTLPADLNEFDTPLPRPDDVLTISNISEMMPGAVCPLTGSFTGWCIDYGLQHMQVAVGARRRIESDWQITAWAYGHLFLNLSGNVVMSAGVLGSTPEQTAQTLCGRTVPELKAHPPLPLWRRIINTGRLLHYALSAPAAVRRFGEDVAAFDIPGRDDSGAQWREIRDRLNFFEHAMAVHIQSSALSGFLCAIVENMVSGRSNDSTGDEQGEAVRLLSGATEVESALMLEELDRLVDRIAGDDGAQQFRDAAAPQALAWLRAARDIGDDFQEFMAAHGHRGYRELCMRDPAWTDDPLPLVRSMQAAVRGRLATGTRRIQVTQPIDWRSLGRALRWTLPRAHAAIRRRELTKSQLVQTAHQFKGAFRRLGMLLQREGCLPEADLVNFFSIGELEELVTGRLPSATAQASARREALVYQQQFEFPEISVGRPQPMQQAAHECIDGMLQGRPASRGVAEGTARVAHSLEDAAQLQAGEILVAPITDIGWTPYFSLIGGLVTDLGSAVSHGAVVAREYGLPCVVNSRQGTRVINTGDRIRVDGDSGRVEILAPG